MQGAYIDLFYRNNLLLHEMYSIYWLVGTKVRTRGRWNGDPSVLVDLVLHASTTLFALFHLLVPSQRASLLTYHSKRIKHQNIRRIRERADPKCNGTANSGTTTAIWEDDDLAVTLNCEHLTYSITNRLPWGVADHVAS